MEKVKEKEKYCAKCYGLIKKKEPKYFSRGKQYCGKCFLLLGNWD